jgi:hypothetical protein
MPDWVMAAAFAGALFAGSAPASHAPHDDRAPALILVAGPAAPKKSFEELTPEERMQRRYPQPVKVGDLIGLPVLDYDDRTIGRVQSVVRTADGKIKLIMSYGGFLGFGQRPVAVPIEVVGIAGRQLAALDMTRAQFDAAPTWDNARGTPIAANEMIRVALYKR